MNRMARKMFFLFVMLITYNVFGQSELGSSSIEGIVIDVNGAAIAGAFVSIKNVETGLERKAVSNAGGNFSVPILPVGRYLITVSAEGFTEAKQEAILTVGETTSVSILLRPKGAEVEVVVTAENEVIEKEEASTGTTIPQRSIADLPIRGRNFPEFVQLTPGVIQESDRKGLVIAGQRSINSNISIDGADFNDALQGNQRGGNDAVFFFPQTAVKEFQVVRSGASAEVGRTGSGFVNVVTKSGTNEFRGEAFFFNRNDRLTSPDAFGNDGANNQNLFGGSVGGPIVKQKAFFFVGAEQNFLRIPYFVDFAPTTIALPRELAELEGEQIATNDPTAVFSRFDFYINSKNTLNLQYTYSRLRAENFVTIDEGTVKTDIAATQNVLRRGSSNGLKGSLVTVFSSNLINELRAQVATDNRREDSNFPGPDIRISGVGRIGGSNSRPRIFNTTRYQVTNTFSIIRGNHRFKLGFDVNVNRWEAQRVTNGKGTWRFNSLQDYINLIPRRFDQAIPLIPNALLVSSYQREYAFFMQDRIKLTKNLTFSAGIRWEGLDNPNPTHPNQNLPETQKIPDDFNQWQPRLGLSWNVFGNKKSVLRVSSGLYVARTPAILFYRVFVNNDVVTRDMRIDERSGACRTATNPAQIPSNCYFRGSGALITYPNILTQLDNPAFLAFTTRNGAALTRVFGFDPDFKNPRTFQAAITWEQEINEFTVLSIGYLRTSAWNLQRRIDRNLFAPTIQPSGFPVFPVNSQGGTLRPNPNIGVFSVNESTAHSSYDALVMSVRRRFTKRFQFEANYTFSKNRDDDSNERNFSRETTLNPFNLKLEAGPSKQDIRHNFNVSGVIDLGWGFTLSGILIARSGLPYTARIIDGEDFQNDGNDANDRAIVNGKVVGRNTFRQPNFFNLDLRLLKSFKLGELGRLAISAEVFNVTRSPNRGFGVDAISDFCTTNSALIDTQNRLNITCPSGTFPSITAGVPYTAPSTARFGGPRQLQLGVRFSF
ncbi:MAG: carboxypeptidase regulatory-like domain-containing protein [Pyrinomonadaceae bacterium]|nr:carboxypeptidase regulatory-like domain-containing protein [Pyrinomonadaceae bacterium]